MAASTVRSTRDEQVKAALAVLAMQFAWALIEVARQHALIAELDEPNALVERALGLQT